MDKCDSLTDSLTSGKEMWWRLIKETPAGVIWPHSGEIILNSNIIQPWLLCSCFVTPNFAAGLWKLCAWLAPVWELLQHVINAFSRRQCIFFCSEPDLLMLTCRYDYIEWTVNTHYITPLPLIIMNMVSAVMVLLVYILVKP